MGGPREVPDHSLCYPEHGAGRRRLQQAPCIPTRGIAGTGTSLPRDAAARASRPKATEVAGVGAGPCVNQPPPLGFESPVSVWTVLASLGQQRPLSLVGTAPGVSLG